MCHMIDFLEEEEKLELCHVHPVLFKYIKTYSPEVFATICIKCRHHPIYCICKKQELCLSKVVLLAVFILVISLLLLAITHRS
jgi:hypothetical protein